MLKISVHTIRLYEHSGLILIRRNSSGRRIFSEWDIERLRCIRRMIIEDKLNIEGIRKILSMIPCWLKVEGCNKTIYENCPAYNTTEGPCWSLKEKPALSCNRDCYSCPVYREAYDCSEIKNLIKKHLKISSDKLQ